MFPNEIKDVYSTSKVYLTRTLSSWWKIIKGRKNKLRTRCFYKARSAKNGGGPHVRLEVENLREHSNQQARPNRQTGAALHQQNGLKRRTRIAIIDDIYGRIVGYQDTAGPSYQEKENPVDVVGLKDVQGKRRTNHANPYNYRRLESIDSVGIQPRCHEGKRFDNVMARNRVAEKSKNSPQEKENPVYVVGLKNVHGKRGTNHANPNNYRRRFESIDSVGIQPRYHEEKRVDNVMDRNRVAERPMNNSETANNSSINTFKTAKCGKSSSMMSRPNSQITPEMIRMRDFATHIKRGKWSIENLRFIKNTHLFPCNI